jgi:uncharacterized Ntn-hydrolase superfamily protein
VRRGTYSIVARDPVTGDFGVGVQSHWFSVGSVVSWAEAGVGAVATQSLLERSYGPLGLDRMRGGEAAPQALDTLLGNDAEAAVRQVAFVDAEGRVGVHTGDDCIAHAGHRLGEGFSCQANLMARAGVPEAMAEAFGGATGPLAERLVEAMDAAEAAGGDVRGRQSAALLVVPRAGEPWRRDVDLRVDDHADPVAELHRLLGLQRAYAIAEEADTLSGQGRHAEAAVRYQDALERAPEADELLFFAGLGAAYAGDLELGCERVRRASELNPRWREALGRLDERIAPGVEAIRRAIN